MQSAKKYLGVPYQWGGTDPAGPGLLRPGAARARGPRRRRPPRRGRPATPGHRGAGLGQARPGDLVVFGGGRHIGIYVGDGKMLHAPKTGDVVRIGSVYETPTSIRRVLPAGPAPSSAPVVRRGVGLGRRRRSLVGRGRLRRGAALRAAVRPGDGGRAAAGPARRGRPGGVRRQRLRRQPRGRAGPDAADARHRQGPRRERARPGPGGGRRGPAAEAATSARSARSSSRWPPTTPGPGPCVATTACRPTPRRRRTCARSAPCLAGAR